MINFTPIAPIPPITIVTFGKRFWRVALVMLSLLATAAAQPTQATTAPTGQADPKAEEVIRHALEVLGGGNYVAVRSIVGRGFFTAFQDGQSQIPARFLDYIVYPDHERTEFSGGGN